MGGGRTRAAVAGIAHDDRANRAEEAAGIPGFSPALPPLFFLAPSGARGGAACCALRKCKKGGWVFTWTAAGGEGEGGEPLGPVSFSGAKRRRGVSS